MKQTEQSLNDAKITALLSQGTGMRYMDRRSSSPSSTPDKLISCSEPGNILCFHEKMIHVKSSHKIPSLDCPQHTQTLRCTRSTRVIYVTLHLLHTQMLTQDVRQSSHINNGGCTKENLKVSSSISWSDFWFKPVFKLQKPEPNVEITFKKINKQNP